MMNQQVVDAWERQMEVILSAYENDYHNAWVTLIPEGVRLNTVVVASGPAKRRGMMGRRFDDFDAMLFVEREDSMSPFHNLNVPVPLLVAFFDVKGRLVDQFRMNENDDTVIRPRTPFRYALELSAERNNLAPDTTLDFG